jgi:AraC-like DNA-binding protein
MSGSTEPHRSKTAEVPPIAGRAGQYRESPPAPPLRRYFRCVWTNFIPADHSGPISVVPDGCVDLLWRDGALRVAGPDVIAATLLPRPGNTIVGVRFQPGAARGWLGLPMSELVGLEVDLVDLWGGRVSEMTRKLEDAPTTKERSTVLQHELSRLAPDKEEPARDAAAVFHLMQGDPIEPGTKISVILDRLDTSARTLRRRSYEHFGYGPKTLDRILRFQRLLSHARATPRATLARLAYDTGYADQAHLSREVRDLTGFSALALVKQIAI